MAWMPGWSERAHERDLLILRAVRETDWLSKRVMPKIDTRGECWTWTGALTGVGYGSVRLPQSVEAITANAHRVMYVATRDAPVPYGLSLDHLCRNRQCVRPDHFEPVEHGENLRRSPVAVPTRNAAKHRCAAGHDFDESNTYLTARGQRRCRACHRLREAQRKARGRVAV